MSGSGGGGVDKTQLKRWIAGAALIAAVVLTLAGVQHSIHYYEAARNASYYSRDAKNEIAIKCAGLSPEARADCAREINNTARQNQRDEYDLYSQQAMALWTGVMGGMAILGVGLTVVGVYLIWGTWKQTAEAAENSRDTLNSYLAKERAILRAGRAHFSFESHHRHANGFKVYLTNIGDSAAHIESVGWSYLSKGLAAWPERMPVTDFQPIIVAAEDTEHTRHLGVAQFPKEPFWLVGTVEYRTLATGRFKCHFCYKVNFVEGEGYGPDSWVAEPDRVSGMPRNT